MPIVIVQNPNYVCVTVLDRTAPLAGFFDIAGLHVPAFGRFGFRQRCAFGRGRCGRLDRQGGDGRQGSRGDWSARLVTMPPVNRALSSRRLFEKTIDPRYAAQSALSAPSKGRRISKGSGGRSKAASWRKTGSAAKRTEGREDRQRLAGRRDGSSAREQMRGAAEAGRLKLPT